MALFVDENLVVPARDDELCVTGPDARHAISVRRVRLGESIRVGNGSGVIVSGVISSVGNGELVLRVSDVREYALERPEFVLVQALAKGGRDELAIQAATELGVSCVVPWQAERSISVWSGTKRDRGRGRWASVVREASKQSDRAHVPTVSPLVSTRELVPQLTRWTTLVLHPEASVRLTDVVRERYSDEAHANREKPIALIVGPEGGVSDAEISMLRDAAAECVCLGDTVLRTSTAGPAALAVLNALLDRW